MPRVAVAGTSVMLSSAPLTVTSALVAIAPVAVSRAVNVAFPGMTPRTKYGDTISRTEGSLDSSV